MKAILYDRGSPDKLLFRKTDKPVPDDGEVLIKIFASAFNAADYRSMKMGMAPKSKIFGSAIAGEVEAAGKSVRRFSVGDAGCGETADCGFGGFAESAAVPESVLVQKPPGISFETAAAVPLASVTALQALRKGEVRPGHKVLICGAGGGVGTFAVQLARRLGAEGTAVCGTRSARTAVALGADHIIDYTKEDLAKTATRYDAILAVKGNYPLSAFKRLLAPDGICVMVGGALSQIIRAYLFGQLLSLGSKKIRVLSAKPNADDLEYILSLVEEGV